MPSNKRLKSVTHSIISHAMGVTSMLHDNGWLYYRCVRNNQASIEIDLITGMSNGYEPGMSPECTLAKNVSINKEEFTKFAGLAKTFKNMLGYESWSIEEIKTANVTMYFNINTPHVENGGRAGVTAPYAGIAQVEQLEGKKIAAEIQCSKGNIYDFLIAKGDSKIIIINSGA